MTNNKILFACLTLGLFIGPNPSLFARTVFNFRAAPYIGIGTSNVNEKVAQLHGAEFSLARSWSLSEAIVGGIELGAERALFVTQKNHTTNIEMLTWASTQINAGLFMQKRLIGSWALQTGWRYGSGISRLQGHENTPLSHTVLHARGSTQKQTVYFALKHALQDHSGWYLESALQRWQLSTHRGSQSADSQIATPNGLRLGSYALDANDPWLQERKIFAQTLSAGVWWHL